MNTNTNKNQQDAAKIFRDAESLYEAVMARLNVDPADEVYYSLVMGMLRRQTKDHLIFSIWSSLDAAQSNHLRDFIGQATITMPWMKNEDALIEFAMMYPALMKKINKGLMEFFRSFIKKFNEISVA